MREYINKVKNFKKTINQNNSTEEKFVVDNDKFELFIGNNLVSESGFNIEQPDEWFNENYVTIFNLKTIKEFQGKGFAKQLLNKIFQYVKNELKINIITLLIYKNNTTAHNLYINSGFEVFQDFEDDNPSYILIKKL